MNQNNYTYEDGWHYREGDLVRKHSGSWWQGRIVGFYSTGQTTRGYAVQLSTILDGPVQIYPQEALELVCRNSDYDKQAYKQGTVAKRS